MQIRLLAHCPDQVGVIARVTSFLGKRDLNIIDLDQHVGDDGRLFMRLVLEGDVNLDAFTHTFGVVVGEPMRMQTRFSDAGRERRAVILASREPHCLLDQLHRFSSGELPGNVVRVISNHEDHRQAVLGFGVPYSKITNTRECQRSAERKMLEMIEADRAELVILARYMRILSPEFLDQLEALDCAAINIHHSFLPAFAGADPYAQALARGVKMIGATAHYVTAELDAGPIIAQATRPISHRDDLADLIRIGRDLERVVLADAVRAELTDRVIRDGGRTIVF